MANRNFSDVSLSLEKNVVTLYVDFTVGVSGAPTLVPANSKGVKSIARNSAGDYTLTLADTYRRLLAIDYNYIKATAPSAPTMSIKASGVGTATPTFEVVFFNNAGTATDPASGEEVLLVVQLSNSSAF